MEATSQSINDHYGQDDLETKILAAFEHAGKDLATLTRDDLETFDEFHIRGRDATRELAQCAHVQAGWRVLDLGCGVGGAARTLAAEYGCSVVGLDLVEAYCRVATLLTESVGLGKQVTFQHGDATAIPFDDASFDAVWTQHATMNLEDKARLCSEVHRVLRPGGRWALYEICTGSTSPPYFPVPWASDSSINFLVTPDSLRQMVHAAGFRERVWIDRSASLLTWFNKGVAARTKRSNNTPPPLGIHLLMGTTTAEKIRNLVRSLEEDRIRVIQGVWVRV